MDPALWEVLEGAASDEVAALVRLRPGAAPPPGLRLVVRFGDIATCRLRRGDILGVRQHASVVSLKAPRPIVPEPFAVADVSVGGTWRRRSLRESGNDAPTGRGSVVGVVDWGCDFTHPNFLGRDGRTRLRALWDQRPVNRRSPAPYGYGVVHDARAIDRALGARDPFVALGYDPVDADVDGTGSHGTHVLDIAAGLPRVGPGGIAPGAELVFVHMAMHDGPTGIGNSVSLLEAIDFIARTAEERPWVINLSLGSHGGPHDGSTLVEQAMDALVTSGPGRAIVQSCGNYLRRPIHTAGWLRTGERTTIDWLVDPGDETENELEVWYPGVDAFGVRLVGPGGRTVALAPPGSHGPIVADGVTIGRFAHRTRDPNNGDNHVSLLIDPVAGGVWRVVLEGLAVERGDYHVWIERDEVHPGSQSRLRRSQAVTSTTTGTICNGHHTITVGAHDPRSGEPAYFSSAGPTRDGRPKPDLLAPGLDVVAARSAPWMEGGHDYLTAKSGTSMAAPHVTGTVALMYEAAGQALPIHEVRAGLRPRREAAPTRLDVRGSVARAAAMSADAGSQRPSYPAEAASGFVADPPVVKIEIGRHGMFIRVEAGATFVPGLDKVEQAIAMTVRALVGDAYNPELATALRTKIPISGTLGLEGIAKPGERVGDDRGGFGTTTASFGLEVVRWLRDEAGLTVRLDDGQVRRLEHAWAVEVAWQQVFEQTERGGGGFRSYEVAIFPVVRRYGWVTQALFTDLAWSLGPLVEALRVALVAFEARPGKAGSPEFEARNRAIAALWNELNKGADALDAVRADEALVRRPGYAYLFPELVAAATTAPSRSASAPAPKPPDGHHGRLRFLEVCLARFPDLAKQAAVAGNRKARRDLLDRFTADFKALIAWSAPTGDGEDPLQAVIAEANAAPFPCTLRIAPPGPLLPAGAEVSASMGVRADHWLSLWDYRYEWDLFRLDPGGAVETSTSRLTMLGRRLGREATYTWTDYQRLRRELEGEYGPPGVGAASMAASLGIIRLAGTLVKDAIRAVFERPYEKSLVLPGPGVYVLCCVAADPDRSGGLRRVPSAAYQLLVVLRADELSQRKAETALEELRWTAIEVPVLSAAIASGLLTPDELEQAKRDMEQARVALKGDGASLYAQQRSNLERALADKSVVGGVRRDAAEARRQIQDRLAEIDRITAERTRRLSSVRGTPYRVIAVLVTDLGATMHLVIEAVDVATTADGVEVLIVDSTATRSGFERRTEPTRVAAIRAALIDLLESSVTGYGRGYCTILVPSDGRTGLGAHERDTFRIEKDIPALITEMIEGSALIVSILALLAAPFTAGASLAILIPVGIIGVIPSAYRIIKRNEEGTFAWDMETALDLVNVVSAFFGAGQAGSGALKLARLTTAFQLSGHGANGLGIVLGTEQFFRELEAISGDDSLLPHEKRLAMVMAVANKLLGDGVMVGHSLAMRAYGQMLQERMDARRFPLAPGVLPEGRALPPAKERTIAPGLKPAREALRTRARALVGRDIKVLVDPALRGQSAEVRYVLDAYGFIDDVYLALAEGAGEGQLPSHAATAKQIFKFTGVLGKARTLIDWARAFFARDPSLKVGKTRAWEARLELEKLPQQLTDYMRGMGAELAGGTRTPADVDAYVRGLRDQLAEHETALRDASPGRGRIAADDRTAPPRTARQAAMEDGKAKARTILGVESGAVTVRDAPPTQAHISVGRAGLQVDIRVPAHAPDGGPITLLDIEEALRQHAALADQRKEALRRPDPARPWDGEREARYRGYLDAEDGYRWELGADGVPRYVASPGRPARTYDPVQVRFAPADPPSAPPARRRTGHVPGLWEKLPMPPEHVDKTGGKHDFRDTSSVDAKGVVTSQAETFYQPPGAGSPMLEVPYASVTWMFDPRERTLIYAEADMGNVPSKITGMSPELSDDGTPTQAYLSLRALRELVAKQGATIDQWSRFRASQIEEIRSICELEVAIRERQRPGAPLDELIPKLHAAEYPRTPLEQIGFHLKGGRVVGGVPKTMRAAIDGWQPHVQAALEATAQRYGIGLDDLVLVGFHLEFDLVPIATTGGNP